MCCASGLLDSVNIVEDAVCHRMHLCYVVTKWGLNVLETKLARMYFFVLLVLCWPFGSQFRIR